MTWRPHLPPLGARDRRALRLGAWLMLPVLLATLVVRPWVGALVDGRAAVERERALLSRELRLVADAPRDGALLLAASRALAASAPRLFEGADDVTASAELARYVAATASESGLTLERTETETPLDAAPSAGSERRDGQTAGAPALRVVVRAHGDVLAVAGFLEAIETGPMLVRVERIAVARVTAQGEEDSGTLSFTATLSGLSRARFIDGSAAADSLAVGGAGTIAGVAPEATP